MDDELLTEVVSLYRAGKRVRKALRIVKKPTVLGLLSIAGAVAGGRLLKNGVGGENTRKRSKRDTMAEKTGGEATASRGDERKTETLESKNAVWRNH